MNKSGLSDVVATVLLLLLTVAAVGTLSSILVPFVKERLYGSTDCANYEDTFSFVPEIGGVNYNCYNNGNIHGLSIKVKPGINESDGNLKGFQISFQSGSSSKIFLFGKISNDYGVKALWLLGDYGGNYYYPSPGEIVSYGFDLNGKYTKAEIRSVLSNGKICKASDSIELVLCDNKIDLKE